MNKKLPRKKCKQCGKECSRPEKFYCDNRCQQDYQNSIKIHEWLTGKDCGYNTNGQVRPFIRNFLILHHKDVNYTNNTIDNLQVLCPNCHSLTDTHRNLNKGKGRKNRK